MEIDSFGSKLGGVVGIEGGSLVDEMACLQGGPQERDHEGRVRQQGMNIGKLATEHWYFVDGWDAV